MDTAQQHQNTDIEANRNAVASVEEPTSGPRFTQTLQDVELSDHHTTATDPILSINSTFDKFRERKHETLPPLPSSSPNFKYF